MKVLKYRSLPFLGGSNYSISLRRIQSLSLITDAVKISLPHHRRRIDLSPSDAATRILSSRSRVGNRSPPKQGCLGIAFRSGRIYVIDTKTDPEAPSLHKVVEPEDIVQKTGLAYPHTAHCLEQSLLNIKLTNAYNLVMRA